MAFIFVPLLAITAFITIVVWSYASHAFVVIVEDTANGNEVVVWDDEPMHDWLWQSVYVAWLAGVWLVPAALIARLATRHLDGDGRWFAFAGIAFAIFWLLFPVSLLSSMAAESRMAVLHGGMFERLGKNLGQTAVFYLISFLVVGLCTPVATWLFIGEGLPSILIGALLLSLGFMLYARLMGRLACIARLTRIRRKKAAAVKKKARRVKGVKVNDPWEVPEEVEREEAARGTGFVQPSEMESLESPYIGEVSGYDVSFKEERFEQSQSGPVSRQLLKAPEIGPTKQKGPAMPEPERVAPPAERNRAAEIVPDKLEMARGNRQEEKPPESPWGLGVWLFPIQPKSATTWVFLALGIGIIAGCVRLLDETWPWR